VPDTSDPARRVVVSVDMESYSRRDNALQYRAQLAFRKIMEQASDEIGLDRVKWLIQQAGDGELAILPAGTSERRLMSGLADSLDRLLREYNHGLEARARLRLRVGVHEGPVHLDGANGYPGEAVVTVCRLVDSPQLKAALKRFPDATVAMIVSDRIHADVVRQYRDLRPERYQRITASIPDKDFEEVAWMYIPHEDLTRDRAGHEIRHDPVPSHRETAGGPPSVTNYGQANIGDHGTINVSHHGATGERWR
jgi:hypothetical protein